MNVTPDHATDQPPVASEAAAANLIGALPIEAEGEPVGTEEILGGTEAAIDGNAAARMVRDDDEGFDGFLRES